MRVATAALFSFAFLKLGWVAIGNQPVQQHDNNSPARRAILAVLSYEKQAARTAEADSLDAPEPPKTVEYWGRESLTFTAKTGQSPRSFRWNSTAGATHVKPNRRSSASSSVGAESDDVYLFVHIAKTGGSSFDEILKAGVNGIPADCIVEKKHYEDKAMPLEERYDFPKCRILSTEFSRFQVSKFLMQKTQASKVPAGPVPPAVLSHVKFFSLMREPFARLLSQFRHDKYYTPRRFKGCVGLEELVAHGASCIQAKEPAYRYQNFQTMMLGGCQWNHKTNACEPTRKPAVAGGGFVGPTDVLENFVFVGVNEHFEASVCLFYHTVGDQKHFRSFCRGTRTAVPHVMQGSWITKKESSSSGGKAVLDSAVLRAAVRTNELDFKLYWAAYDDFKARARALEEKTGLVLI